jgi:hypothetical protein
MQGKYRDILRNQTLPAASAPIFSSLEADMETHSVFRELLVDDVGFRARRE